MESFADRVNKAFASLPSSGVSSWRVSEDQPRVNAKPVVQPGEEGDGEEDEPEETQPCWASAWRGRMDVEGDDEEEGRQMRLWVGLDPTLDFEEEEDEFDKAAFGREGDDERLYMSGIKEVDNKVNTSASLPLSLYDLKKVPRDPRANHSAARARLEEDAREAADTCTDPNAMENSEHQSSADHDSRIASEVAVGEKGGSLKVEVPDRESPSNIPVKGKPTKRVRFSLDLEEPEHEGMNARKSFVRHKPNSVHPSQVPDHVKNPSKYTHYTLDWSVKDSEMSNYDAFKACEQQVTGQKLPEEEGNGLEGEAGKVQYIQRPGRTSGISQKSDMEEATTHVRKTMCIDQFESESENAEVYRDDAMDMAEEEPPSDLQFEVKKRLPGKRFRSKKEAMEETDG